MAQNPLLGVRNLGQSLWLDYIERGMLEGGDLQALISQDGITGQTSNPAIFETAINGSDAYDRLIIEAGDQGSDAFAIYEKLVLADVGQAADLFRPVYDDSGGLDGYVSLEVSPHLARDTAETVRRAGELWRALDRPNVMIKVPATVEGLPALRQLIREGVNVNATLLFGLGRYREVARAYIEGLEARHADGNSLEGIASVASFFLSRIDSRVDTLLDSLEAQRPELAATIAGVRGQVAIASARLAYRAFGEIFAGTRWQVLEAAGARVQRLLWASTSTKNPAYSDIRYVEALIGPHTVNTLPMKTLKAYRDHGDPAVRIDDAAPPAQEVVDALAELGIDLDQVTADLEVEGLEKFIQPFDRLLAAIENRYRELAG